MFTLPDIGQQLTTTDCTALRFRDWTSGMNNIVSQVIQMDDDVNGSTRVIASLMPVAELWNDAQCAVHCVHCLLSPSTLSAQPLASFRQPPPLTCARPSVAVLLLLPCACKPSKYSVLCTQYPNGDHPVT